MAQRKESESVDVQGRYHLTLDGNAAATGLQVKKDPGIWIIWLGSAGQGKLVLGR